MAYCKLEDTFRDNRKPKRLARALGIPPAHARGLLAGLWSWAVTNEPDGNLEKLDNDEIAEAADWADDADSFVEAMAEVGLLDRTDHGWELHKFLERSESYKKAKNTAAKRAKDKAKKENTSKNKGSDVCGEHVGNSSPHVGNNDTHVGHRGDDRIGNKIGDEKESERIGPHAHKIAPVTITGQTKIDPRVEQVVESYAQRYPKGRAQAQHPKTVAAIKARFSEDYTPEDIATAIDGNAKSKWHAERGFHSLSKIVDSAESMDRFIALANVEIDHTVGHHPGSDHSDLPPGSVLDELTGELHFPDLENIPYGPSKK